MPLILRRWMNAYLEIFDRDGEDLSSAIGDSSSWRRDQSQTREKMPWITLERSAAMALERDAPGIH